VSVSEVCTGYDDRFFSYRRDSLTGRQGTTSSYSGSETAVSGPGPLCLGILASMQILPHNDDISDETRKDRTEAMPEALTMGVEEEFFVLDPATRAAVPGGESIMCHLNNQGSNGDVFRRFDLERQLCMIEGRTAATRSLGQVRSQLRRLRAEVGDAATETRQSILAAGTSPILDWRQQRRSPNLRYPSLAGVYGQVGREFCICGCHIHVGVADQEMAVQVLGRLGPWLPAILALSASSPFWMGLDTGYASYRALVWARLPVTGIPEPWHSLDAYRATVRLLIESGVIVDASHAYWDVRLGTKHETVEIRIADMCTTVDETVMLAGLCRALVRTCLDEVASDCRVPEVPRELLVGAKWRAARFGLDDCLIDALARESVRATVLIERLLTYVRPALEEAGDWHEVWELIEAVRSDGTSAQRQRRAFARGQRLEDVADLLVGETTKA
jgi:carboxylate-amine ligase